MMHRSFYDMLTIFLSLLIAFGLMLLPLPRVTSVFMPDWALLVVFYWAIFLPQGVGLGIAWLTGLVMDALTNSLLGEHALASVLAVYLALKFHRRIRTFFVWQQILSILVLLSIYRAVLFWIQGVLQLPLYTGTWFSVMTGALLWPLIVIILHDPKRRGELTY